MTVPEMSPERIQIQIWNSLFIAPAFITIYIAVSAVYNE